MNWYLAVLKNYAGFKGRARRKEFWMFVLFNWIFFIAAWSIDTVVGNLFEGIPNGLFTGLYMLVMIIPTLAVQVRRLHDVGEYGWVSLIGLIPFLGLLVLVFAYYSSNGNIGANKYGPDPKEVTAN